jgi:hypothetical protein
MTDTTLDRLRSELDDWRARLDRARVQANLGGKEARDVLRELEERLKPAFGKAKEDLDAIVSGGAGEARALATSLRSGWEEVRRKHRELTREAERAALEKKTSARP